jgi:hypothetical protein
MKGSLECFEATDVVWRWELPELNPLRSSEAVDIAGQKAPSLVTKMARLPQGSVGLIVGAPLIRRDILWRIT